MRVASSVARARRQAVVVKPFVTHPVAGRFVRAFEMICPRVRADGGRIPFAVQTKCRQALS